MAKSTPSGPNDIFNGDQQERIYQEVLDTGKERLEKLNDKKNVEKIIKVLEDEKSTFGDAYKDVKKVINEYLEKKYPDTDPDYKEKREQERAVAERKIRNMILNSLGRATDVLQAKIDNTTKEGGKKNEKLAEALGKLKTIADNWTMEQAEKARDATTRKATPTKAPAVPKAPARPATTRGPAPATGTATTGTGTAGGLGRAPTRGPRTPERPVATKAEVVDLGERVKRVSDASKRDFDKVDKKIDAKIGEVKDEIKVLDGKMDGIDGRVKEIEKRLGIIGDTIEKWDREEEERRKKIEDEEKKRKETPDPKEKKKIDVRIKIEEDRKKFIEKKKKEKEKERIELKKEKLKLDKEKEAARIALRKAQKKWDEMVKKNPGIIDEFAKAEEAAKEIGAIRTALDGHAMYMRDVPVTEINGIDDFNTNKTKWDNVKNVYGAEPNGTDLARGAENKLFWFYTKDGKEYRMALDEETTNKYLDWKEYLTVGKEVMVSLNQQIQDLGIDIRGKEISDAGVQKQIEEKAKEVFEGMLEQLDPSKYSKEARYALALHTLGVTSMNAAYEKVKDMIKEQLGKEKTSRDAEGVEEAKGMTVPTVAEIKSPEDIRKARTKWENVVNKYGEAPNIDDRTRGDLYWRDFDASTPKEKLGKDKRGKDELTEYRKWIQYYGRRQYCETTVRIIVDKNIQAIKDLTDPHQADTDARDVAQKMAREIHNPDPKHLAGEGLTKENFVALMHDTMGVETEEQAFLKFLNLIKLARIPKGREGKNVFEVADRIEFPPRKLSEVIREDKKAGETLVSSMYRVIRHINKIYGKGLELSLYEMHRALIDIIKCRGSRSTLVKQLDGKSKAIPADIAKKIYIDFLLAKNEHLGEQDLLAVMIAFEPKKPYVFNIRRGDSGWAKEEKKTGETDEILDDFCTDGSIFAELQDKLGMETREFIKFVSKVAPNYKKIRDEILDVAGGKKFTKEQVDEVARSNKIEPAERLYSLMMISLWADKIGQAYKHALYLDQEGGVMVPQIVEHQGPDIEFFGKINSMEDFKKAKARWDKVENQFGEKPDKKEVFGKSVSLARNEDTRFDRGPVIGGTSVGGEELYWEDGKPLNAQELNEYRTWRTYFDLAPDIKKNVDRILQNVGIDVRNKGPFSKDSEEVKTVGKEALKLMLEMVDQYLGHSKDNSPDSPDDNRFSESARLMLVFYALDGDFAVINKKQAYEKIRDILAGKLETERTARDSKTMESAGEMVVPTVLEIKSPEDIRLCLEKWNNVVNKYGEKAGDSDFVGNSTGGFDDEKSELYWKKDMPGEMGKGLGEDLRTFEDKHSYREFMDYYTKTRMSVLHDVDTGVDSVMILHTDGRPEELEADARDEARKLTERLLGNYKEGGKQAMLFYAMGVKNEQQLYLKLLNMIKLVKIPDPRRDKNIYETADTRKYPNIPLKDYLKQPNGTKLVGESVRVLKELHAIFGSGMNLGFYDFKHALVEVIKSRGGKSFEFTGIDGKKNYIDPSAAASIYRKLLMLKDPNIGEKEILAILISIMPNKAFVYDIVNDQKNGWDTHGRKKVDRDGNVLGDFDNDGAMFHEIADKLGLNIIEASQFLDKATPIFEALRNQLGGGANDKKSVAKQLGLDTLNKVLSDIKKKDLITDGEKTDFVKNFNKLMAINLWPEKVGPAWKHSKYIMEGPGVPQIIERQGPDVPSVEQVDIVFVSVEEKLNRIAERLADERLDQELKEMSYNSYWELLYRFDKPIAKWWKRNAMEGYRDKYRREFVQRLKADPQYRTELMTLNRDQVKDGWVMNRADNRDLPNEGVRPDLNGELDAIAERFGIAWSARGSEADFLTENETIDGSLNANAALGVAVENLAQDYINTGMSDDEFRQRVRNEIMPMAKTAQGVAADEAVVTFLEERGVNDVEGRGLLNRLRAHRNGLIELDMDNLRINLGFGRAQNVDVKTQTKDLTAVDRWTRRGIERLQRSEFLGRFLSPPTIAVMGFGVANVVTQMVTSRWTRYGVLATLGLVAPVNTAAAAAILTGAIAGGAMGYFRQNKEQLHLKAQKERRRAMTYNRENDNKSIGGRYERRLEATDAAPDRSVLHPLASVSTLTGNLNAAVAARNPNDIALAIAAASALNNMSEMGMGNGDNRRLDLIRFSNEQNIESERLALVRAINRARRELNRLDPANGANRVNTLTANATNAVRQDVAARDSRFRRFKNIENWTRGVIPGAVVGGLISGLSYAFLHDTVPSHLPPQNLTPAGNLDPAHFEAAIRAAGVDQAHANAVMTVLRDPTSWNGNVLTPAAEAHLRVITPPINYSRMIESVQQTVGPTPLAAGGVMDLAHLKSEIAARAAATGKHVDMSKITLDHGHLSNDAVKELTNNGFTVREVAGATTINGVTLGGAPNTGFSTAGWRHIATNFNDNQPHGPGHTLDELRFTWDGQPKVGADGLYHFSVGGMLNKGLPHSHLPSGIDMPNSHENFRVLLQGHDAGKLVWREFPIDANGKVALPPEFFDANRVNYVPRMGDTLPGLKAEAVAAGFYDKNGVFQVLASVKGDGGHGVLPIPPTPGEIGFTGDETFTNTVTKEGWNATMDYAPEVRHFTLPYITGTPMQHLEYGLTDQEKQRLEEEQKRQPKTTVQIDRGKGPMTKGDRDKFKNDAEAAKKAEEEKKKKAEEDAKKKAEHKDEHHDKPEHKEKPAAAVAGAEAKPEDKDKHKGGAEGAPAGGADAVKKPEGEADAG